MKVCMFQANYLISLRSIHYCTIFILLPIFRSRDVYGCTVCIYVIRASDINSEGVFAYCYVNGACVEQSKADW